MARSRQIRTEDHEKKFGTRVSRIPSSEFAPIRVALLPVRVQIPSPSAAICGSERTKFICAKKDSNPETHESHHTLNSGLLAQPQLSPPAPRRLEVPRRPALIPSAFGMQGGSDNNAIANRTFSFLTGANSAKRGCHGTPSCSRGIADAEAVGFGRRVGWWRHLSVGFASMA